MTVEQGRAHPKIITATGALRWPVTIAFAVFMGLLALACALVIGEVRDGRQEREEVARRQEDDAALLCRAIEANATAIRGAVMAFATSTVPLPVEAPRWYRDYIRDTRDGRAEVLRSLDAILAPPPECTATGPR